MPASQSLVDLARQPVVLPSMLLCDFGNLEREVRALEQAGFAGLHLDVMDGVFVPNFSYGLTIVRAFRGLTSLPLDVHLMMVNPQQYVAAFRQAGADLISFHAEAVEDVKSVVQTIRESGALAGVALNPQTPVERIESAVDELDYVVLMTVQAGFGGQAFQSGPLAKIEALRRRREDLWIEVDGGINRGTIRACCAAGANGLVVGSAIFGEDDYGQAHEELRAEIRAGWKRVPRSGAAAELASDRPAN